MPDGPGGANVTKRAYAYEVDGLGQQLTDFDDPNVPSLLAIPLLGYQHYDPEVCARRGVGGRAGAVAPDT